MYVQDDINSITAYRTSLYNLKVIQTQIKLVHRAVSSTTILHSIINHERVLLNKARSIFTVMCMTGGKDIIGVTA